MGIQKNVASQKIAVFAFNELTGIGEINDEGNITAEISLDFGASNAVTDTNPVPLDDTDHPGIYVFDISQAETNANVIVITAVSSTANIIIDPIQVFTVPPNFNVLGIEADGDAHADVKQWVGTAVVDGAIPAAAADTAGGLPISDAGGLDLDIALQKGLFDYGSVWVDDAGTASTAWPYGSAPYPTDTIARGKVIADANGLMQLRIRGNHSLAAAMEHYNFIGGLFIDSTKMLNINSFSIEHSSFRDLLVTGVGGNAAGVGDQTAYTDCFLYNHTNIQGWVYNGRVEGACSIRDGGYATFHDVLFGSSVACTLTLQAPTQCDIENMSGTLTLAGMDGGVCSISMSRGAILIIDATCTAGTIIVTGAGLVTDNSGVGCTVSVQVAPSDLTQILSTPLTETSAGYLTAAFKKLFDVASPMLVSSDVMRGTDSASTFDASSDTVNLGKIGGDADSLTRFKHSVDAVMVGTVTADVSNTATIFLTDLDVENNNYYGDTNGGLVIAFIAGTVNQYQTRRIVASETSGSSTRITLEDALDAAPDGTDAFIILGRITELS